MHLSLKRTFAGASEAVRSLLTAGLTALNAMLPAPAALEANPFSPYADARSRDVSGTAPAPGGQAVQVDEQYSSALQYIMLATTVRIMRRRRVVMAAATRAEAVAYTIARFWYSAMDRVSVWHPLLSCMWKGGSQK